MIWKVSILEKVNGYVNININVMIFGAYHAPCQGEICCFDNLDKAFGTCSNYKKCLVIGYFNAKISEPCIESFVYEDE